VKGFLSAILLLFAACRSQQDGGPAATGTLEYVEIDVAPLVPARVVRVPRREGEKVNGGDTLVVLTQPSAGPETEVQRARVTAAEARLRQAIAGPRNTEIDRTAAELRAIQPEVDRQSREVDRLTPLAKKGEIPQRELDDARAALSAAAGQRDAMQEALKTMRSGSRPEEIAAARAEVAAARAALSAATATQKDLVLVAPVSGTVITRSVEPGEAIGAGVPAISIADVSRPFVKVYVGETVLPDLHVGQTASATLDAYPDKKFTGKIAAIATKAEFTPRVALTRDERADLLFAVRVEFDDSSGMLKAGLPVTVSFAAAPE
jgi:HlyD family secretion protein